MTLHALTFDSVAEDQPGKKWAARWARSWPAYRAWFLARGGQHGPSRADCEAALGRHMPELVPVHRGLSELAGGDDLAARFLTTWCPPAYLGGCSIAAFAEGGTVALVRNYDLSPDLNEGLLLRSAWTGLPVMGMVEFLWGLSDGLNAAGLSAAIAYGGSRQVAPGFGVTTIIRYVLETCASVAQAIAVLRRVPSHMAYNVTLADRHGTTATVELVPGGGARLIRPAIATNHQRGHAPTAHAAFTRSRERRDHLERLLAGEMAPDALPDAFLEPPLYQRNYAEGFGTLFTAVYEPREGRLTLRWPGEAWAQQLDAFVEGQRVISYAGDPVPADAARVDLDAMLQAIRPVLGPAGVRALDAWAEAATARGPDWASFGRVFMPAQAAP